MRTVWLVAMIVVAMYVIQAAPQLSLQSLDTRVAALEQRHRSNEERFDLIESRLADLESLVSSDSENGSDNETSSDDESADPPASGLAMLIDSIEPIEADDRLLDEAGRKYAEADKLDNEAAKKKIEAAKTTPTDKGRSDPLFGGSRSRDKEHKQKLEEEASRLTTKARRVRGEGMRLEREASTPRHVISGREGQRVYRLTTDRDLSAALSRLNPGDRITWRGTRRSMRDGVEEWVVRSVSVVK